MYAPWDGLGGCARCSAYIGGGDGVDSNTSFMGGEDNGVTIAKTC